ncbi:MAG: bifunctional methylenetetrahydrofolate dehydrogenase/methenyltetrahydrofolate cyclohydrolase FolD [Thermaerobacter sp.]|nr:bifunctional methylenetetrahydrofolate dehydrogenase/methenyltetrahydrofolate cyclohydrolase FolD [Thermaerobacter sp.]
MAKIIDGKEVARGFREGIAEETKRVRARYGRPPGLAVVLVGDDPASAVYVRNKERAAKEVGFHSEVHRLPADTTQQALLQLLDQLNRAEEIDGYLVQLPLPPQIDPQAVVRAIDPEKDVDGLTPVQAGRLLLGVQGLRPCTPQGVMELLRSAGVEPDGKEAVVVGRSAIVGKPMAHLLLGAGATVTIAHSHTRNLPDVTRRADILVVAAGRAGLIGSEHVKPGAAVIDVGTNRGEDGKLKGDVRFSEVEPVAGFITPVPGGVGPMTIALLLRNCLEAMKWRSSASLKSPVS